ncbi:MAG: hypothetical protein JO250_03810 [Armatimonadetes bacterium]|nr:hypothetical protein [Armatimonadota bacterium]
MEQSTASVVRRAFEHPEGLAAAEWVYAPPQEPQDPAALRQELAALDAALRRLAE